MKSKILILSSEFPPGPGGIGQHAFSLASGLSQLDYDVSVITVSDYSLPSENRLFDSNNRQIEIIRFKRYFPIMTQILRFVEILNHVTNKQSIPQIIFVSGRFPLVFISIFGNFRGLRHKKKIAILHGSEVQPKNIIQRILNQKGISRCNQLVCVSKFTEALIPLKIKLKVGSENLFIIGNGISPEAIQGWEKKAGKNDLPGSPRLLTVGNVIPRKGQHLVVEAMPELMIEFPEVHFHIVGIRRDTEKVDVSIKNNGLESACTFHGRVADHSDLSLFYRNVDILMLLSENQSNGDVEGYGIVALEANYFGVPVIGAMGTGVEAAIKDGYSGLLVDATNKIAVKEAVSNILNNREFFGSESKKWSMDNTWNNISIEFEKVINHN